MKTNKVKITLFFISMAFFCFGVFADDFKMPEIKGMPKNPKIVLCTMYTEFLPGLRSIAKDFEKKTGIAVEVQGINDQLEMWVRCHLISQDPPALMLTEQWDFFQQLGQSGLTNTFNDAFNKPNPFGTAEKPWKNYFFPSMMRQAIDYNGKYYRIPYSQYGVAFFYNKDKYDKYGLTPPATWADFINNCSVIKKNGDTAIITSVVANDGFTDGIFKTFLDILMRPHIDEVNIRHDEGVKNWKYDPNNVKSVENERIDLSERIVAFEKGIIDPAKAPEFREVIRMMKDFSNYWRSDYTSINGNEIYEAFARGETVQFQNGTWYLPVLANLQDTFKAIAPQLLFTCRTFLFPEITNASTKFPLEGKTLQQTGLRGFLIVLKQKKDIWKNEAGLLLAQYLTTPEVAQKVWDNGESYDIPAMKDVEPKPESEPFLKVGEVSTLEIAVPWGYDVKSGDDYRSLRYKIFSGQIDTDEYLKLLSKSHRDSLIRAAETAPDAVDHEFIKKELGRDFPQ